MVFYKNKGASEYRILRFFFQVKSTAAVWKDQIFEQS